MARYSPLWLYECIVAQCTIDLLNLGYGIDVISKKYADSLKGLYDDIEKDALQQDCGAFVKLLKETNVRNDSVELLNNYIYFRFNFRNRFVKRKLKAFILNPFSTFRKRKLMGDKITFYLFKYIMDWELGTNIKIKKDVDWSLESQRDFKELSNIVKKPLPMHDQKKIMQQLMRDENQRNWYKK